MAVMIELLYLVINLFVFPFILAFAAVIIIN